MRCVHPSSISIQMLAAYEAAGYRNRCHCLNTQFKSLFTLSIDHSFYAANCQDFEFLIPQETGQLLNNGKLVCRIRDGVLHCLYAAGADGTALNSLNRSRLRFGLKLLNPYFSNYSNFDLNGKTALYQNTLTATAIDPVHAVIHTGSIISHTISSTARPVTVTLENSDGTVFQSILISSADNRSSISFDLNNMPDAGNLPPGFYKIKESYTATTKENDYYSESELLKNSVFGIVEINLSSDFYTTPPNLSIHFASQTEKLKYYVVAKNYSNTEFNSITVTDTGHTEESRPQINFSRIESAAFTSAEISAILLGDSNAKIALFKSTAMVSRQEKARKRIQLSRNGDVLVSDLPAPGIDKAQADIIIHVAKP